MTGQLEDLEPQAILLEVATLIAERQGVGPVFAAFAERVLALADFDYASLLTWDPQRSLFREAGAYPAHLAGDQAESLYTPRDVHARMLAGYEHGLSYRTADALAETRASRHLHNNGLQRVWSIAISGRNFVVGIVTVAREVDREFDQQELQFLGRAARLLGSAVREDIRLLAAERDAERSRLLSELSLQLNAGGPLPVMLEHALDVLQAACAPDVALVSAPGDAGVITCHGPIDGEPPVADLLRLIDAEGHSTRVPVASLPGEFRERMRDAGITHAVIAPLSSDALEPGILLLGRKDAPFREGDSDYIDVVAALVGQAIAAQERRERDRRERTLLQLTLGSLSEGILLLDTSLRVAYYNEAGRAVAHIVTRRAGEDAPFHQGLPAEVADQLRRAVFSGEPVGGRWHGRVGGAERWLDYQFLPLDHSEYRLVCVVRNATEEVHREAEQERYREELERTERLAALGGLVGGVAHELNNPLTAVMGFAELLAEGLEPGPEREDLDALRREAERARKIVQDLLFMARPAPVERQPFTLESLFGHIERVRRSSWLRAGIRVTFDVPDPQVTLLGSEDRITQVLLNLITNAEDAVEGREQPAIALRFRVDNNAAVIEVEDNGKGMDEATRARIFEPFYTTRKGTGTGLGLSVSHGIIQAHRGRMDVASAPGAGSTFRIVLPMCPESAIEPRPAAGQSGVLSVLVVDDEPTLRKVCQRLVHSMGHECAVAGDPQAAITMITREHFDLVLCDYRLAGARADQVVEAVAAWDPALVNRMVIATGAAGDPGVRALTERYGMRVLPKPYGVDEINRLLGAYDSAAAA